MKIYGIGTDIANINRIKKSIKKKNFINRLFNNSEIKKCNSQINKANCYAKRFAAKEACSKALGTGLRKGVFYRDMEIINLPSGKPTLRLYGGALSRLNELCAGDFSPIIELSITDDKKLALAIVIIYGNKI